MRASANSLEFTNKYSVRNEILGRLAPQEFGELAPRLKLVDLSPEQVLNEAGERPEFIYFIESGIVSQSAPIEGGHIVVALAGAAGLVGLSAFLGGTASTHQSLVLLPGLALRIDLQHFSSCVGSLPNLRNELFGYTQQLIDELTCSAVCNARHDICGRVSRFLLQVNDLAGTRKLPFTHNRISSLLGVRRAGVTEALLRLERGRAVSKDRGYLEILDRDVLKAHACDCYARLNASVRRRSHSR